nr:hypothetical protein [Tanacetum cinerariifolium]
VDEHNTEEIMNKEHSNTPGSTAQVQPPVMPISIPDPDVPRTQTKPSIPYPSRDNVSKTNDRIDKLADQISNLIEIVNKQVIALVSAKAVEKTCVTCGGAHAYYDCIATDSNQPSICAATGSFNQVSPLN